MTDAQILTFGGCNLRAPLARNLSARSRKDPQSEWGALPTGYRIAGPAFFTYTTGEMLQAIACYRGETSIPSELHNFCNLLPRNAPSPGNSPLHKSDLALVEPNTNIEIEYDGYFISRYPLQAFVYSLRDIDRDAYKIARQWFERVVNHTHDDADRSMGERLGAMLPSDLPRRDTVVDILLNARSRKSDVREGLETLVRATGLPCGVVAYTWSYMPDGRPISWPSEFHHDLTAAATALGLPLFEPRELVRHAGVGVALQDDFKHYADGFMPTVAKSLIEFALSIPRP